MINKNSQIKALMRAGIYLNLAKEIMDLVDLTKRDDQSIPVLGPEFHNVNTVTDDSLKDWYARVKGKYFYLLAAPIRESETDSNIRRFWYDMHSDSYFGPYNQVVTRNELHNFVESDVDKTEEILSLLISEFNKDSISLPVFYVASAVLLRNRNFQYAALSSGGINNLRNQEYTSLRNKIQDETSRLDEFYTEVNEKKKEGDGLGGVIILTAAILARLMMYPGSTRSTYYNYWFGPIPNDGEVMIERRTLGLAEHCLDCVYYSSLGWQMAGYLPSPGIGSQCISNCRCSMSRQLIKSEDMGIWIGRI